MVIFRVRGVPVRIGWSWLVIVALVFWSLDAVLFPDGYPGRPAWQYAVMAGVATLLLFASLLAHELSHTLQSLREGVRVKQITLFLFGGVSEADEPIPGPGAELRVVAAGPIASLVLAVGFGVLALLAALAGVPDPVFAVLSYLAQINALLLVFNVVPALPLDGGRLLHAWLWRRSGDRERATLGAANAGRAFALLLITLGLVLVLTQDGVGGVWFAAVGWFLLQAVRAEVAAARATQALSGRRVRDLMSAPPVLVGPDLTIADLAEHLEQLGAHTAYPVVVDGRHVGTLALARAGEVSTADRARVRVRDVMAAPDAAPTLSPEEDLVEAAQRLAARPGPAAHGHRAVDQREAPGWAVVLGSASGQEPVGVLSVVDLERALEEHQRAEQLRRRPSRQGQESPG